MHKPHGFLLNQSQLCPFFWDVQRRFWEEGWARRYLWATVPIGSRSNPHSVLNPVPVTASNSCIVLSCLQKRTVPFRCPPVLLGLILIHSLLPATPPQLPYTVAIQSCPIPCLSKISITKEWDDRLSQCHRSIVNLPSLAQHMEQS